MLARCTFTSLACFACSFALHACAAEPHFPLQTPIWRDPDEKPFARECKPDKKGELACMPEPYVSPLVWDAADNTVFRPIAKFFAVDPAGESTDVNSFDEVPDSSWFQNRLGMQPMTQDELLQGACGSEKLDTHDPDGSWLVDMGKENGATPGFRVRTSQGGKYLLKADEAAVAERSSAASVIASRLYYAVGYNTPCESVIYIRPALLQLKPGLKSTDNTGITRPFDQQKLDRILSKAPRRGDTVRLEASRWLPNPLLGPFEYEGVRDDDPNDVVAHEDRRELRGGRLIAAWLNHFDSREQNTMNTWISQDKSNKQGSPGYVLHYYLDFSDSLGSEWDWDGISRRLGHSYYLDFGHVIGDFATLGIIQRPWDRARRNPGAALFGYFSERDFDPEAWRAGYPNPAFSRMSERDGAWMARLLSRFSHDDLHALVMLADFSEPAHAKLLEQILYDRQRRILARYFSKLSPLSELEVRGDALCAVDLARRTQIFPSDHFHYSAQDGEQHALTVRVDGAAGVCVQLEHGQVASSAPAYRVVRIYNGATEGPLEAHLYDLGVGRSFRLVGIERTD
jgi:hypothetical protein